MKIILINTTHPGNIGAVARAIKNMGFRHLCLVSPKIFPSDEATARAGGAEDILSKAVVVSSLEAALADCHWVMGLSARTRKISLPTLDARSATEKIVKKWDEAPKLKVGLLFGQEQSGLLNEELAKCHYQVMIPANYEYASLNLAQAVQIVTYELRMAILHKNVPIATENNPNVSDLRSIEAEKEKDSLATIDEVEHFYQHLEESLILLRFLDPKSPGYLMRHLRRLYAKAELTRTELNILQGILTAIKKSV